LDSTTEEVSHGLESAVPIKSTDNLDCDLSDDYSAKLSDVFIDFSGDFDGGIHSRTGDIDDREADIENAVCYSQRRHQKLLTISGITPTLIGTYTR
jgi:hypothetical protein